MGRLLALVALVALVAGACGGRPGAGQPRPTPSPTPSPRETPASPTPAGSGDAVEAATDALARWLGPAGDRDSIEVVGVEQIDWPDGCLGIHRAGRVCTMAIVPGYRVLLGLGDATYEVRTDRSGRMTVWAPQLEVLARFLEAGPNLVLLETDDGGRVDAQLVPGSDLGVDLDELEPGDPVGAALAPAPQREGQLVVWLDPAPERAP